MKRRLYRQGDVLLREVESIPDGATDIEREGGRIVLAHGEVTGHSHAIASQDARFVAVVADGAQRCFLDAHRRVALNHEEHSEIQIARGTYEVVIQREWDATNQVRNVVD